MKEAEGRLWRGVNRLACLNPKGILWTPRTALFSTHESQYPAVMDDLESAGYELSGNYWHAT
eukprot:scaffold7723_cov35-Cyclotella_meneghiniana.AAC.2